MLPDIPSYLVRMVRRDPPHVAEIVAGSTPVVCFGDMPHSRVATLGINPSAREFIEGGTTLSGRARRLATLESLDARDTSALSDAQVRAVLEDCYAYFDADRNPYRRWFDPLDEILRALRASYYDRTACHLDLVQWATQLVWGGIMNPEVRRVLLHDGVPHLRDQLRYGRARVVLLNGRQVIEHVTAEGLAELALTGTLAVGRVSCRLYEGHDGRVRYLGWSTNLQSSFGVSHEFRRRLAAWVEGAVAAGAGEEQGEVEFMTPTGNGIDIDGHIIHGTTVASKTDFARLLGQWLKEASAPTIGDVGRFGGTACLRLVLGERTIVLNADTKRSAVEEYVRDAARRGADAQWTVVANQRGRLNKVNFREDGGDTSGWYCYLTEPLGAETTV